MSNLTPIWSDRKRIFCGLPWTFTTYTLTSDRLFIETGMLGKHEDEVRLYRIFRYFAVAQLVTAHFRSGHYSLLLRRQNDGRF